MPQTAEQKRQIKLGLEFAKTIPRKCTLQEAAKELGISTEAVSQTEGRALYKLLKALHERYPDDYRGPETSSI